MTTTDTREARIRLCSLRIRYRKAWLSQADSKTLAALLTAIESVNQSLSGDCVEPETLPSAGSSGHERGTANGQ
ncbi:hypothetical protein B7764_24185 (plasmid) [Pantoea ananatis]|uniref:hypothetical protein n=1 Tax=Pantoea ananas TaxID=553 RepID=UPI000B621E54|nr:hypothetical protein [Pantoea ananatis]ASN18235.1 hypothetical protein B7764_24185 [Pantoea ananatis]